MIKRVFVSLAIFLGTAQSSVSADLDASRAKFSGKIVSAAHKGKIYSHPPRGLLLSLGDEIGSYEFGEIARISDVKVFSGIVTTEIWGHLGFAEPGKTGWAVVSIEKNDVAHNDRFKLLDGGASLISYVSSGVNPLSDRASENNWNNYHEGNVLSISVKNTPISGYDLSKTANELKEISDLMVAGAVRVSGSVTAGNIFDSARIIQTGSTNEINTKVNATSGVANIGAVRITDSSESPRHILILKQ